MTVTSRPMCYRCVKPVSHCICRELPKVANQTPVLILQHPRERHHPLGTVRLARLALEQVEVRECAPKDPASVQSATSAFPEGAALLFPGPRARELKDLTPSERPRALVVLDGTWHQAKTLYRDCPALQRLPQVALTPPRPSQYRIRREPHRDCVSTLEAIVHALTILEPDTHALGDLEHAFLRMIDRHVRPDNLHAPRPRKARPSRKPPMPPVLLGSLEHVVVGYAEMATSPQDATVRAPVLWSALRPATGETFWMAARPPFEPAASHLAHMGVTHEQLQSAPSFHVMEAAWREFAGSDCTLVVWNTSSLGRAPCAQEILLKEIYCNVMHRSAGHLEDVVTREGLRVPTVDVPGRAGPRLARAWAVLEHLRGLCRGDSRSILQRPATRAG